MHVEGCVVVVQDEVGVLAGGNVTTASTLTD